MTASRQNTRRVAPPPPRQNGQREVGGGPVRRTKKRSRLGGAMIILLLLLCGAAAVWLVAGVFGAMLKLQTVVVEGLGEDNPQTAQILDSCGLSSGDRLYAVDAGRVEAAVLRANPYLASVEVERRLPDTVAIRCTVRTAAYYTEIDGEYFALSSSLCVLEQSKDDGEFAARGLVYLILPEVRSALAGQPLRFCADFDPSYLGELLAAHTASGLYADTDLLRIESRFDVRMIVRGSYALTLGSSEDAALKLELGEKILADKTFSGNAGAFLDLSDPMASSAILDKTTDYTVLWRD